MLKRISFYLVLVGCTKQNEYLYPHHPVYEAPTCILSTNLTTIPVGDSVKLRLITRGEVTEAKIGETPVAPAGGEIELPGLAAGDFSPAGTATGPGGVGHCVTAFTVMERLPVCTLTVSPAVNTETRPVTVTLTASGKVDRATIDGDAVTLPTGSKTIIKNTPGKFQAKGNVVGPGGEAVCDIRYDILERRFHGFPKQIKDLQILTDIDILWIIDNSGSMMEYQEAVKANAQLFMQEYTQIPGLKWKMGLLSTDERQAPFIGFTPSTLLNFQSPEPVTLFQTAVGKLTTMGAGREETFTPLLNNLKKFPDFLRQSALLATIFITDAPEQSWPLAAEVLEDLKVKKGSLDKVYGYGVFSALDLDCPTQEGKWNYAGSEYQKYIEATHGSVYPLCRDFGQSLLDIAKKIVSTSVITTEIPLPAKPYPDTITVLHKGTSIPSGPSPSGYWTYNASKNAIIFHDTSFAPGAQEFVEIKFEENYLTRHTAQGDIL